MRIPIVNLDQIGIIADISPHNLPINAWSSGKNVRFVDGQVEKARGYQPVFTPPQDIQFAFPVNTPTGYFWMMVGGQRAYVQQPGILNDCTRLSGPYNNQSGNVWTGGVLNGIAVLNNYADVPQAWVNPGANQKLVDLPNWPVGMRCVSLRPFKNYLVALGVKQGVVDNPYRVLWSDVADPGTVPETWDIADETNDAGDAYLSDTNGILVDQKELKGANIIYKDDCAYIMQHIGGIDIFGFRKVLKSDGLLMPNGVAEFSYKGDKHVAFGPNEIYYHDGSTSEPLLHKRMRNWVYRNLDTNNARNSFIVHNQDYKEIWICFPQTGELLPNMAVVWNYIDNTTSIKELPRATFVAMGQVTGADTPGANDSWDTASGTWNTDQDPWGQTPYTALSTRMLMFTGGAGRKAYLQDTSTLFGDQMFDSYVERIGISVLGKAFDGKPIYDSDVVKIVTEVWPRIKGDRNTVIDIYVGSQMDEQEPVNWQGPYPYVVGQDHKINPYVTGKIISIRFACKSDKHWKLSGYDLEVVSGGKY